MGTLYHKDSDTTDMHKIAGYIQAGDPGAIGAGKAWIDTTGGTGAWILKVRNATNAGWEAAGGEGFLKLDQTTPQSVINGKPTVQGFNFAIAPTVGSYSEGKLYYDEVWKCLSLNCGRDVNLQIGQEDLRRVYNDTGATIYEGNAVYTNGVYSGGTNDTVTVAYARADNEATAFVLGVATQDIPDEDYGFITVRGHVNDLNTNAIGGSYVSTQGMFLASKIGGVASNSYTFTVVNTGSGGLSYTEVGDAFTLDIGGVVNPTAADVAAEILLHFATASIMAQATTPATVVAVAGAVSLANGVDTVAGDVLYLSAVVAGGLTTVAPDGPNLKIRVGRLITKSATVGRINVRIVQAYRLNDLANVSVPSPATDDVLKWNGTEWVNGAGGAVSAGPGIEFFNASPTIISKSNQNQFPLLTLSKTPVTTAEQTITGTGDSSSTPIPFAAWLYDTALARTSIDAGLWEFNIWANISNAGGTTTITRNVYAVLDETVGTVMITTEGGDTTTSRTATATDGTPFAAAKIDVGGTALTDSYLKTTKGMHRILSWVSDKVVKVSTISTYTNDVAGMAFGVWKKAVSGLASVDISTTTASGTYQTLTSMIAASAYAITVAHKLGAISFVTSTASRVVTTTYDGVARNTHIATPLITLHGNLAGLQGGSGTVPAEQYYHMTSAQHTAATRDATNAQNGLMPTAKLTGWDTAASKAHDRSHAITSTSDHTSTATAGQMLKADASGLPTDATNTDTDVADAVSKKHSQNTDTKIIVGDTEVSITDTGANGVISLKADNATKATVDAAGVKVTAFTTAGVVHNAVTTGLLSSSKIVAADVTANTLTNTEMANLGTSGKIAKFGATGLADGTNTDTDVASAVTLKHTQNTDSRLVRAITQGAHGFAAGDVLKFAGGVYAKAKADTAANAEVVAIVYSNDGASNFTLAQPGSYIDTLTGLTANTLYFLSDATAGLLTATEPTTEGSISKPIFFATSTTAGYFINYRGAAIASTSSYYRSFQNGDLSTGVLTVAHNLGHKYCTVVISNNSDKVIVPDEVTFTDANNVSVDLTSYGTISGTWHAWCLDVGTTYTTTPRTYVITTVTGTYTILSTDDLVRCNSSSDFTVTLPTAVGITGRQYVIKNIGANVLTIEGDASETIDGVANKTLYQYGSLTVVSNGANWEII